MKTEVFNEDISKAIKCLNEGGIILYPTDTVWGLGCDATNSEAVEKIFRLKKRNDSKSMLTLVNNEAALERIIPEVPDIAWDLIEAAVEPITIIFDEAQNVAPELIASDGSLGVRITNEKFSNQLCRRFGKPIVSTSANVSGEKTPSTFSEISEEIINGVDYIVEFGRHNDVPGKPSNIVKLSKGGIIKVIR